MKRLFLLSGFLLCMLVSYSQQSVISLSAGYLIDIDRSNYQIGPGNGWRVIGTFQETLKNEKWALGISSGLMEDRYLGSNYIPDSENEIVLRSVPIFISGKYFVGKKDWKGYLKGSAGLNMQLTSETFGNSRVGLYSGVGIGVDYHINNKLLINTEYEFILWQNDYYGVRWLHSFNLGIGYKF